MSEKRTTYLIELRPPADDDKPHLRLKRALKCLSRSFRLQCVSVAEKPPQGAIDTAGGPTVAAGKDRTA